MHCLRCTSTIIPF